MKLFNFCNVKKNNNNNTQRETLTQTHIRKIEFCTSFFYTSGDMIGNVFFSFFFIFLSHTHTHSLASTIYLLLHSKWLDTVFVYALALCMYNFIYCAHNCMLINILSYQQLDNKLFAWRQTFRSLTSLKLTIQFSLCEQNFATLNNFGLYSSNKYVYVCALIIVFFSSLLHFDWH